MSNSAEIADSILRKKAAEFLREADELDGGSERALQNAEPGNEWLDSSRAAQLVGMSRQSCRRWAMRGLIIGGRSKTGTWLFKKSSLLEMKRPA